MCSCAWHGEPARAFLYGVSRFGYAWSRAPPDGWMDGRKDGWIDEWHARRPIGGRMDGLMDGFTFVNVCKITMVTVNITMAQGHSNQVMS